jgi:hypothetical protein
MVWGTILEASITGDWSGFLPASRHHYEKMLAYAIVQITPKSPGKEIGVRLQALVVVGVT